MLAEKNQLMSRAIAANHSLPEGNLAELVTRLNPSLSPLVTNELVSAWVNGGLIDANGGIWLEANKLASAVRIPAVADLSLSHPSPHDVAEFEGKLYYRGGKVASIINQITTSLKKSGSPSPLFSDLKASVDLYMMVRGSESAKQGRNRYFEALAPIRRELKAKKIAKLGLSIDELTNETLNLQTSEFFHIRSPSFYTELTKNIHNGFVVNQATYRILAEANPLDEKSLYRLCDVQGWKKRWFKFYQENLTKG